MEELQEFKLSVSVDQCHLSKLCSIKCASQQEGRGFELGTFFGFVCVGSLWVPNTFTLGQIGELATGVNVSVGMGIV